MNILVIHTGTLSGCLVASSLNQGLRDQYGDDTSISWVVNDETVKDIFKYNKKIYYIFTIEQFRSYLEYGKPYDMVINLHSNENLLDKIDFGRAEGLHCDPEKDKYVDVLFGHSHVNMNLFQVYYRIAGLSWRGQGFDLVYRPKTRSKKSRVGLAMANANLRNFVRDNLDLEMSKLWVIPYKKNIFRRMDEINRCKTVVTDDLLTLNLALYLRKSIYFLQSLPMNFNVETFGLGSVYQVPEECLR